MRPTGFIGNHNPAKVRNRLACARRVALITAIQRILANADSIVTMWKRRHVRNAKFEGSAKAMWQIGAPRVS